MTDEEKSGLKTDPVCRMEVRKEEAVITECGGVLYYFCSEGCRNKFLRERTCDAAVIGGGNSALQVVENLHTVARNIHLISTSELTADPVAVERLGCFANLNAYIGYKVLEFTGDRTLAGITIRKKAGAETLSLPVKGAFIAVGLEPNSSLATPLVKLNERREIMIHPDCSTSPRNSRRRGRDRRLRQKDHHRLWRRSQGCPGGPAVSVDSSESGVCLALYPSAPIKLRLCCVIILIYRNLTSQTAMPFHVIRDKFYLKIDRIFP